MRLSRTRSLIPGRRLIGGTGLVAGLQKDSGEVVDGAAAGGDQTQPQILAALAAHPDAESGEKRGVYDPVNEGVKAAAELRTLIHEAGDRAVTAIQNVGDHQHKCAPKRSRPLAPRHCPGATEPEGHRQQGHLVGADRRSGKPGK